MTTIDTRTRAFLEDLFVKLELEGYREAFLAALSDDVVFNAMGQSPIAGRYEGKEVYRRQALEKLHAQIAIPAKIKLHGILVDGEMACARFQSRGGKGVNGTDISMDYCWVFRIANEKVQEIWGYYDTGRMIALFE